MIASLSGRLSFRGLNSVIVEVNGVGYLVGVSLATLGQLPEDGQVFLHAHTHVRESAIELFGFATLEEKSVFEMLISVAGIGPKTALTVLSGLTPDDFRESVLRNDAPRLTSIPGVGKKTAERIILELREKVKKTAVSKATDSTPATTVALEDDLISSLVNLGYKEKLATQIARQTLKDRKENLTLEQALKAALKKLMK
jgi:Holliday junction DNA helicase RuvA